MNLQWAAQMLQEREQITIRVHGSSMQPRVMSGERVTIVRSDSYGVGDVVLAKVKGRYYFHLVAAKDRRRGYFITNNRGRSNGWTKQVYGKLQTKEEPTSGTQEP